MKKKVALFAFNGEPMCFVHALLNALDLNERDYKVALVIEGSAVKLVKDLAAPGAVYGPLYAKVKELGLIDCVCKACAAKMESTEAAEAQGLELRGDMSGHPSIGSYLERGYEVISL